MLLPDVVMPLVSIGIGYLGLQVKKKGFQCWYAPVLQTLFLFIAYLGKS